MSDGHQSRVPQLDRAADWAMASVYRWLALLTGAMVAFLSMFAIAIRYTWRVGGAEPQSRLQYALVETFANVLPGAILLVVVFLIYAFVRELRGLADAQ